MIVLVHGAGGGGWEWRLWQRIFVAGGWTVAAPDLQPGEMGIAATTVNDYVTQIQKWLDTEDLPPFVVGASMGGILAALAVEQVNVAGLVLVNSLPPCSVTGWPLAPMHFPAVISWPAARVQESLRELPDYYPNFDELFPETWRAESGAVMNALYRGVAVTTPEVPCLVVCGELDEDVPPPLAESLARVFDADFLRLAGTSHLGILLGYRAQLAAAMVLEWIECMWVEQAGSDGFDSI